MGEGFGEIIDELNELGGSVELNVDISNNSVDELYDDYIEKLNDENVNIIFVGLD
mgnify:CR=1 FL=1